MIFRKPRTMNEAVIAVVCLGAAFALAAAIVWLGGAKP
jgi:hypothetical protein